MSPVAKISRMLVGVDFDEASASALKIAGALASAWAAEITVFHAAMEEAPVYFTATQMDALEAEREQSRERTADQLRAFAGQHVHAPVHVVVEDAPPQDALLRLSTSFHLIVVGTHRRHGARRWWLGSVAEAVVRHSARPVLVVPVGAVLPRANHPATILAAGAEDGAVPAWVDALVAAFGGNVLREADIHQCPDHVQSADLIVLSMPEADGAHSHLGAIVQVLKECVHPVLFVPSANQVVART